MRALFGGLLLLHGVIHLLGSLAAWDLVTLPALDDAPWASLSRPLRALWGAAWLIAALALMVSAGLFLARREGWWTTVALGVVASQGLVLSAWASAKAGTLVNVVLAAATVLGWSLARFHHENEAHAAGLLASTASSEISGAPLLQASDLTGLPEPVRAWIAASGALQKPRARTGWLRQRGEMRTRPGGPFMHAEATQVFTFLEPGFVWCVDVTMFGFVPVVGRDSHRKGHGRMLVRAAGLVTVADGAGPKLDQGTLLRWLGELAWFPSAALGPAVHWEAVDELHARATVSDHGTSVTATFTFDERHRVVQLSAERYFNGQTLERWEIPMTAWATLDGVTIPTKGSAIWKLAAGDFEYYRWEILATRSNVTSISGP